MNNKTSRLICALSAVLVLASACATVTSSPGDKTKANVGVTYFLPKRLIAFDASRVPMTNEDLEKAVKEATDGQKKAKDAAASLGDKIEEIENNLKADGLSADRIRDLNDELKISRKMKDISAAKAKEFAAKLAELEVLREALNMGECAFSYEVKLEAAEVVPDTSSQFSALMSHSTLRDDAQTFAVTPTGLLSSTSVEATDHTGDILVEIAGDFAGFSVPSGVSKHSLLPERATREPCLTAARSFKFLFDPGLPASTAALKARLDEAKWPFEVEVIDPATAGPFQSLANPVNFSSSSSVPGCIKKGSTDGCGHANGLFYRTAAPVLITVFQKGVVRTPLQGVVVPIPQAGPVGFIPLESAAFVKTTDKLVFDNGTLTSWTTERPSGALEFVRLPVRILKQLVSVPAELIKLRVDYSSQQAALTEAYAKQFADSEKFKLLKKCVSTAETNNTDPSACFPADTDKTDSSKKAE